VTVATLALHSATPTTPYGGGPTLLGRMTTTEAEIDDALREIEREHANVNFVECAALGRRWRRDSRDARRLVELVHEAASPSVSSTGTALTYEMAVTAIRRGYPTRR
jgi:hypothetical protein